jgi:orotidine-5'-phosphate decarboxylase
VTFGRRVQEAVRQSGTPLVAGIDPRPSLYPPRVIRQTLAEATTPEEALAAPARVLSLALVELAASEKLPAVKPNIAFFEALGPAGLLLFQEVVREARRAGLLVISDVKRGDIGSTSEAYAGAYLGEEAPFRSDAITASPWLGRDALAPMVDAAHASAAGVFCLVRTSNPGAAAVQDLPSVEPAAQTGGGDARPIHERVADMLERWNRELMPEAARYGTLAAVVGATVPDTIARLRQLMPSCILLAPGVGSQGASVALLRPAFDEEGGGALIPVSRGIAGAWQQTPPGIDWKDALRDKVRALKGELRHVLGR